MNENDYPYPEDEYSYPYPEDEGNTHFNGCYRSRGHHNCAVAEIERLKAALLSIAERVEDLEYAIERTIEALANEVSFLNVNIPFKSFNALKAALYGVDDD